MLGDHSNDVWGVEDTFPPNDTIYRYGPKWTGLAWKDIILAIKHKNQSGCSIWARDREKWTGYNMIRAFKIHEGVMFTYLAAYMLLSRCNHVCEVSNSNFQGFGSNFRFSCWFWYGPYNSVALPWLWLLALSLSRITFAFCILFTIYFIWWCILR